MQGVHMPRAVDWQECADLCATNAACEAWSFSNRGWCSTKTGSNCTYRSDDWTWGTKECGNITTTTTTTTPTFKCADGWTPFPQNNGLCYKAEGSEE